MNAASKYIGLAIVAITLALAVSLGAGQPMKTKGALPAGFKDLGLSAKQKEDVYAILADYKGKIKALEAQVKVLKDEEHAKCFKILTDDQRAAYLKAKGLEVAKSTTTTFELKKTVDEPKKTPDDKKVDDKKVDDKK